MLDKILDDRVVVLLITFEIPMHTRTSLVEFRSESGSTVHTAFLGHHQTTDDTQREEQYEQDDPQDSVVGSDDVLLTNTNITVCNVYIMRVR